MKARVRLCSIGSTQPRFGLFTILAAFLFLFACSPVGYPGTVETLTLAVPPLEQNALMYVAENRGFFTDNGLNVTIRDYDSGVTALDAVIQGKANLAEAAEFPVVRAIYKQAAVQIIAANDKFENDYIVAHKDRGIEKVADLEGKRIGVTRQTVNEFFLGRFLELNGIEQSKVTLVDLPPARFADAFNKEEVDALIAWQPHVNGIAKQQPNVVVWPAQSNQAVYGLLVGRSEWVKQRSNTVERLIQALKQAEDYTVAQPDEAKAIVQKRLKYDSAYVTSIWSQHHFSLALELSLVVAMTDEAHWMIDDKLTTDTRVPDFGKYIYTAGLRAVKPEAVNLVP